MNELLKFWKAEIDRNNFVAAVLVIFVINAFFNWRMGWNTANDTIDGLLYGGGFVAFALIGAYAAAAQRWYRGGLRAILWGFVAIQLVIGQTAGWQTIGLILEAGAAKLDAKASQRTTTDDLYSRYKAERKTIGAVEPLAGLKAHERLECSKVSARYPDGVGPRCTDWRTKIAKAERALFLDAELVRLAAKKGKGPQIRDAGKQYEVPTTLANTVLAQWHGQPLLDDSGKRAAWAVDESDTRFALQMFLTFSFELVATFGFLVCGVGATMRPPPGAAGRAAGPASLPDDREAAFEEAYRNGPVARPRTVGADLQSHQVWPPAPLPGRDGGGRQDGGHASNTTPVTINFTPPGFAAKNEADVLPAKETSAVPKPAANEDGGAMLGAQKPPAALSDRPVKRDHARRHADQLRTFKAACLLDAPGQALAGGALYHRYEIWAEGRAMTRSAFFELMADCAGIEREIVGDEVQFRGIALRDTRANLRTVG